MDFNTVILVIVTFLLGFLLGAAIMSIFKVSKISYLYDELNKEILNNAKLQNLYNELKGIKITESNVDSELNRDSLNKIDSYIKSIVGVVDDDRVLVYCNLISTELNSLLGNKD